MIIHSKFKDYYDAGCAGDSDRTIKYIRDEIIEDYIGSTSPEPYLERYGFGYTYKYYIIGFCGQVYPCITCWGDGKDTIIYTKDALINAIKKFDRNIEDNMKSKEHKIRSYCRPIRDMIMFLNNDGQTEDNWRKVTIHEFIDKHKSPLYVINLEKYEPKIRFNTRLNIYEFFRVKDAFTAYQEIKMRMHNIASPEKEIPKISDELMMHSKGFDMKYGFRKRPTEK